MNKLFIYLGADDPGAFLGRLPAAAREIELEKGFLLYVFDDLGIRVWRENGLVKQVQAVLEKDQRNMANLNFPGSVFKGQIFIKDMPLQTPLQLSDIKESKDVRIEKDNDSVQYKLHIYYLFVKERKYILWADKDDKKVISISF